MTRDPQEAKAEVEKEIQAEATPERPVKFREVSLALEFMCWVVVALAPMLRLVNGPPVTDDQAAIQIGLVVLAVSGAIGLRIYNWRVPLPPEPSETDRDCGS